MKMMKLGVLAIVTFGLVGCTVDQQSGTAVQSAPSVKSSTAPKSGQTIFQVVHDNFSFTNHSGNAPWQVTKDVEGFSCPIYTSVPNYWDELGRLPATKSAVNRYFSQDGFQKGKGYERIMRVVSGTTTTDDLPYIFCMVNLRKEA